jgi:hypothetical protein
MTKFQIDLEASWEILADNKEEAKAIANQLIPLGQPAQTKMARQTNR